MSEKNEWKPIDSAPKDGTPVLLFARHIDAEASTRVVGSFDGNENGLGWHAQCYVGQPFARLDPSHWMELPPFPGSPAPSAPGDAQDERQAFEAWGLKGCEMVDDPRSMRMDIAQHCAWEAWQARGRLSAPAAGDALDSKRLKWIAQNAWALRDLDNGRKNSLVWQQPRTVTEGALNRLRAAVDAALAAQVPQQGEA